jgi:biotin carboxyl carrier protein
VDLQRIVDYVRLAEEVGLAEVAIEADGRAFRFRRGMPPRLATETPEQGTEPPAPADEQPTEDHIIHSRLVGFFHRGVEPEAAPLVEVGDRVEAGTRLGTIEALRTLSEVVSDVSGTVADVVVDDGQAVEYGQPLLVVRPDADSGPA